MLDLLDHVAAIATAIVAVWAFAAFKFGQRKKRILLEVYLSKERPGRRYAIDTGQRSIVHLMAELRMSEAEIIEAAFRSQKVLIIRTRDPQTGLSNGMLFQHIAMPTPL
jgi:hypothetical protein